MQSDVDTKFMTQTGPDTPMGALLRRFWMPALLASAVAERNGDPVRVRLVGENFVAWRDASGKLGFFDEYCAHRGASLALGHSEGDGLRCLYHGWKFAADGTILETPNCRSEAFRKNIRQPVYPVREAGGLIWVYLGPKEKEPPFPHYKFFDEPVDQFPIYHAKMDCNWIQMLEGTIDPSHAHLLHRDDLGLRYTNRPSTKGDRAVNGEDEAVGYIVEDNAPECEVEELDFGAHGIAKLKGVTTAGEPVTFARVHTWVMPFLVVPVPEAFVITVPMDDTHTTFFAVNLFAKGAEAARRWIESQAGPKSLYDDNHRYRFGPEERWGQDRSKMGESFSGIPGVVTEDIAMTTSMGPIYDRGREHLTPADQLIVIMRRRLIKAARNLESGVEPSMLSPEETLKLGAKWKLIEDGANWQEELVSMAVEHRIATAA